MAFKDFRNFGVWRNGLKLVIQIYKLSGNFPSEEKFGLISDMRRSARSVISNISEGYGRYENRNKSRFYKISRASATETMNHLIVSEALNYMDKSESEYLIGEYEKLVYDLNRLIKTIENR